MASHISAPEPSIVGMMTVTSRVVNRGFSGSGRGRRLVKAKRFTMRRRYRYRLEVARLVRCFLEA